MKKVALTYENALEIIQNYDCIVDASDNPRTRYLINDACVLAKKPLVSGSAVGIEAQLTVYNWKDGPCYRCLYPKAQASAGCQACSDAGVLGPVTGLIGIPDGVEITCVEYSQIRQEGRPHVLLDVRVTKQYEMCALDNAVSVPLGKLPDELDRIEKLSDGTKPVYCVCRRGIASKEAAKIFLEAQASRSGIHSVHHIDGGLNEWHGHVDSSFPKY